MLPNPNILGFQLYWHSIWHYSAILITLLFAIYYLNSKKAVLGISWKQFTALFSALVFLGYFGARVFSNIDLITNGEERLLFAEFINILNIGSLRWYGALLVIIVFTPVLAKLFKVKNYNYFDLLALKLCLFTAIVKQACFFSGDGCYGKFTNSIFGMYFHYGSAPNILPVHPTPLYDSIFHLIFFIFLYKWNDRKKFDGQTAVFFFAGTSIFCFFLEFIRRNPDVAFGLTLAQLTYGLIFFITMVYYTGIKQPAPLPKLTQA